VGVRGKRPQPIYRSVIAPPVGGAASRTLRLPVDPHYTTVCAQASAVAAGDTLPAAKCPLGPVNPGVASAELHVPDP
jgi:hypothetical protein